MNKTLHVKKGDTVKVMAGKSIDKKKTGKVTAVFPEQGRIVVEDVNVCIKHKKARSAKEQGGRIKIAMPIDSSNVMVVCPECDKTTRISYKITTEDDGKKTKVRVCKKCGATLDSKVESVKAKREKKEKERAARKEKKDKKAKKDKDTKKLVDDAPVEAPAEAAEETAAVEKKAPAKATAAKAPAKKAPAAEAAEEKAPAKKAPAKKAAPKAEEVKAETEAPAEAAEAEVKE